MDNNEKTPPRPPEQEFYGRVSAMANRQLSAILGSEKGKQAAYTIAMAMLSAMRTSKTPRAFLEVTEGSIASCISTSYETGLYPGGPNPVVYLVPQAPRKDAQPELQWRITHRGLAILASRAGFGILAVPVAQTDEIDIEFGEAVRHRADPAAWPESLSQLVGCVLVVRRIADGVIIARPWMPIAAILQRKGKSRDCSVWNEWPIEQAQKTIIKWAFARGYVPLDSPEMRAALDADLHGDIVEVKGETLSTTPAVSGSAALGLRPKRAEAPALPDRGEPEPSFRDQIEQQIGGRQVVDVTPAQEEAPAVAQADKVTDAETKARRPRDWQEKMRALKWRDADAERLSPGDLRWAIEHGASADEYGVDNQNNLFLLPTE